MVLMHASMMINLCQTLAGTWVAKNVVLSWIINYFKLIIDTYQLNIYCITIFLLISVPLKYQKEFFRWGFLNIKLYKGFLSNKKDTY